MACAESIYVDALRLYCSNACFKAVVCHSVSLVILQQILANIRLVAFTIVLHRAGMPLPCVVLLFCQSTRCDAAFEI